MAIRPCATVLLAAVLLLPLGCSHRGFVLTRESPEALHYVVIGFGVLTVPKPEGRDAVLATGFTALGVSLSNSPGLSLGVGYHSSSVVAVPANAEDVRVEVGYCGANGVRVAAERAVVNEPLRKGGSRDERKAQP